MFHRLKAYFARALEVPDAISPVRYETLKRLMTVLMVTVSVAPLLILTFISHSQYMRTLEEEMETPLAALAHKTQAGIELYLGERVSTVSFMAHAYHLQDLSHEHTLNRIFHALKSQYQGFVDMGLVDKNGRQIAYVGPYQLKGADYAGKQWLKDTEIRGHYISPAFLGYRGYPHLVIAVHRLEENGAEWTLRVATDTLPIQQIAVPDGKSRDTDVFLVNDQGVLQTDSALYGKALGKMPFQLPHAVHDTEVIRKEGNDGRSYLMALCTIKGTDFRLVAIKPIDTAFRPWLALRAELLWVIFGGIALIVLVSNMLMRHLVDRLRASDERRVAVFAQMEHNQKLSSIGRLAAGVAHEVNNPLAVILEKAGLAQDLLTMNKIGGDEKEKQRLVNLLQGIESTVERARGITHRLLGFARRMEVSRQELHIEEVIEETMGFLEREARHHGVLLAADFPEPLPEIISDRGQLQQIFLNLIGNALDAQSECQGKGNGERFIKIRGVAEDRCISVSVADNDKGMSQEVLRHIFEPFYSTKKSKGTGLGMFITYGIVQKLGGHITVESTEGEGSTFTVVLPLTPPDVSGEA